MVRRCNNASCASSATGAQSNESSYICVNRCLECPPRDTDESGFRETQPGSSFPVPVGSFAIHPNLTMRCKIPNTMIFPAALHLHQPWNHGCSHHIQSWRAICSRQLDGPQSSPEDRVMAAEGMREQSSIVTSESREIDSFGDRSDRIQNSCSPVDYSPKRWYWFLRRRGVYSQEEPAGFLKSKRTRSG